MRTEIDFGGIPVLQNLLRIVGEGHLVRFDAIEYNPFKKRRVEDIVMVKLVISPGIECTGIYDLVRLQTETGDQNGRLRCRGVFPIGSLSQWSATVM
jgi:hypothetical protein